MNCLKKSANVKKDNHDHTSNTQHQQQHKTANTYLNHLQCSGSSAVTAALKSVIRKLLCVTTASSLSRRARMKCRSSAARRTTD
jgi:hypothetical protein